MRARLVFLGRFISQPSKPAVLAEPFHNLFVGGVHSEPWLD